MRVLFLRPTLDLGGVSTRLGLLAAGLSRKGHWVGLATADTLRGSAPGLALARRFTVRLFPSTPANLVSSVLALRRLVIAQGVDVLSSHHRFAAVAGSIVSRLTGVPLVCTSHEYQEDWRLLRPLWANEFTVVPSRALADHMVHHYGMKASDVTVILPAIDNSLRPSDAGCSMLRRSLALPEGHTVCYVGRLSPEKGVQYFLESAPMVTACIPDARFLVVGEGPEDEALRRKASELGLDPSRVFLGPRSDVPDVLAVADVVVIPSISESFGLVALEAMRAGKPVVAAAVGGLLESVRDNETGILVPARSPGALAAAICRLLDDPEERHRLGQNGRRAVAEEYDAAVMVDHYLRVFTRAKEQKDGRV